VLAACGCVVALAQEPPAPVRVGTQGVSQPRLIDVIKPWARVGTGGVSLEIIISPRGLVSDVRVVRTVIPVERLREAFGYDSLAMLDPDVWKPLAPRFLRDLEQGIIDAVRQWRFEPTVVNGGAVPVLATVTVNNRAAVNWPQTGMSRYVVQYAGMSPEMVTGTPTSLSASLTVNVNRYRETAVRNDVTFTSATMPADFAVRYVWTCALPNPDRSELPQDISRTALTIDTAADEAYIRDKGRVRLGLQPRDLERLYLAMRGAGTSMSFQSVGWNEPAPSGITTVVRPDGTEVTVNYTPSPMTRKDTIPWMADYGWNLEIRIKHVWARNAGLGYRGMNQLNPAPPRELPLLLDLLEQSDEVKRLSMPLPRACP
jgi:hypothetical protein